MSDVVKLSIAEPGLAVIELADRANSNLFSRALVTGLFECMERIRGEASVRAVVVHGYDTMFCAGGTKDELLGIFEGRIQFTDVPLYRLFLDCEVPVIAAMQGHALGGGFILGLFADLVVLAEESLYGANFMKYGFTPGMGATQILPDKVGPVLAAEMLYTAENYSGGVLRDRGVPFPVVKRKDVIPTALKLGRQLAEKPLISLKLLKQQLTRRLVAELPQTVQAERDMHRISFAQPEVRQRIEALFGN